MGSLFAVGAVDHLLDRVLTGNNRDAADFAVLQEKRFAIRTRWVGAWPPGILVSRFHMAHKGASAQLFKSGSRILKLGFTVPGCDGQAGMALHPVFQEPVGQRIGIIRAIPSALEKWQAGINLRG